MNETDAVQTLLKDYPLDDAARARVRERALEWLERPAAHKGEMVEQLLHGFDLGSAEGRAMMELAEAYLRTPDAATRSLLLRDKLTQAAWQKNTSDNKTTSIAKSLLRMGRGVLNSPVRIVAGPIAALTTEAGMGQLARHFVLGETIDEALKKAQNEGREREIFSFDILGEGARTEGAAQAYFENYKHAIARVSGTGNISVKLSALHHKFEETHRAVCFVPMVERLRELCLLAKNHTMNLTVDAEEERRLDLMLDIMEAVSGDATLTNWNGLGCAVQAYLKRTPETIDRLQNMAKAHNRILWVRLVKGAYWDSEIKYAQVMGHAHFPVYTQKTYTDLSYMVCAHKMLQASHIYPAFGSHNALSLSGVAELAQGNVSAFETQRLFGMGDGIHEAMRAEGYTIGVYAPVGPHHDLLPYLVRRLLENGANTSFLKLASGADMTKALRDPYERAGAQTPVPHPAIRPAAHLYPDRLNSLAPVLGHRDELKTLLAHIHAPAISVTTAKDTDALVARALKAQKPWDKKGADHRAGLLEKLADALVLQQHAFLGLLQDEGGKTIADAIAEWREAIDFCRFYAAQARSILEPHTQFGPDGERNITHREGRGAFVCISPWNFPLAIFLGQIAAALTAGNSVIAKPAEQTPKIAQFAVELAHGAGIPKDVLILAHGDGKTGAALTGHSDIAGVAFTGSYEVGKIIQRALASSPGPIVPLIAETAGLNAMAVDSSALPEQAVDDIILSAFGSAGQRCSALRILLVEDKAAARILDLLKGAMAGLRVGPASDPATDVSRLIDLEAADNVRKAIANLKSSGAVLHECAYAGDDARFVPPIAIDMTGQNFPDAEIFGPVLQIYRVPNLEDAIRTINARGYALTFGVHTRLPGREAALFDLIEAGNVYINRSMIGATVGVQPFGGHGRSGTGPKAGGYQTLYAYSREKHVATNTAAAGGNASLVALQDSL